MPLSRVESDTFARRMVDAITSRGGRVEFVSLHPSPTGLCIAARINGRDVAMIAKSYCMVQFQDAATYLLREAQAGVEERFPDDATLLAVH